MIRRISRVWLLVAVVGGLLAGAGGANAAVQLGPDLAATPIDNGVGCSAVFGRCTRIALQVPGGPVQRAPSDGVITRWRFRAFCCGFAQIVPRRMNLRTFGPGPNSGNPSPTYVGITAGPVFEIPVGGGLEVTSIIDAPVRIPVATGQWLGVDTDFPIGMAVYYGVPGGQSPGEYQYFDPAVADGVEATGLGPTTNRALAMNATLEPDADKDGYGDETQDCQPTDPASHPSCVVTTPPPPVPVPTPPLPVAGGGPCSQPPPWCSGGGVVYPTYALPGTPPSNGQVIVITVWCSPYSTRICGGRLLVNVPGTSGNEHRSFAAATRLLGSSRYRIAAGAKAKIRVKLNATGRRLLTKRGRLTVAVTLKPDVGRSRTSRHVIKLKSKKAPAR